jgi:hypothetical protein
MNVLAFIIQSQIRAGRAANRQVSGANTPARPYFYKGNKRGPGAWWLGRKLSRLRGKPGVKLVAQKRERIERPL